MAQYRINNFAAGLYNTVNNYIKCSAFLNPRTGHREKIQPV